MSRDLIARAAAAQAAADAEKPERCEWCGATGDVALLTEARYEHHGTVMECENESACHVRFEILNLTDDPPTTPEAPQTPGTAPRTPESSTEGT